MGSPQLDWSIAGAPDDSAPSETGPHQPHGPAKTPRHRLSWRLIIGLLGLAALLGLGAWLFSRLGWRNIQAQLAAQVTYEDQRARAGDVAAVLALQGPREPDWRNQLTAQVRLGLAAPLPAGDLLPAGTPPRVGQVDSLGGDLFSAVVTRDYVDSAGKTYAFDLVQRFRNLAPGQWERLPPETAALSTTTIFQGQRLFVTMPTADMPWLRPALLQVDNFLVQTCADWGDICPNTQRLVAAFGVPPASNEPVLTVRPAAAASSFYPRIFDLASPAVDPSNQYVLMTPALAGRPHDAAAQAALSLSISVQLLSLFAGELSGSARTSDDYFLDALVARAEVRHLGTSAEPQPLAAQNYVPLQTLWGATYLFPVSSGWRTDLAARREAFDFLNVALAGQPAAVDGTLLLSLRRGFGQSLDDWLATALGPEGLKLPKAWTQQTLAGFARHRVADWSQYDGLVMACDDAFYRVQGGSPKAMWANPQSAVLRVDLGSVSPDARYLAISYDTTIAADPTVTNSAPTPGTTLSVLDLTTGDLRPVFDAPVVDAFGWSSAGELIYTVNNSRMNQEPPAEAVPLRAYDPATDYSWPLIPELVLPYSLGPRAWSADHSALLLTVADQPPRVPFKVSAALLTFGPPLALRRLELPGQPMILSPDGRRVVFLPFDGSAGSASGGAAVDAGIIHLNLFDVATGSVTPITTSDPRLPAGFTGFSDPRWSADGTQLAWHTYTLDPGDTLLSAPAAGGPVHVWADGAWRQLFPIDFSPDARYLAAQVQGDLPSLDQYWLFDKQAADVQPPVTGWANSILWSPKGGRLVSAGPAGVSAVDPATGAYEWLGSWQNCQLRW